MLSYGAKERNAVVKGYGLTPEEVNSLKKASRRMKNMLSQRRYMAGVERTDLRLEKENAALRKALIKQEMGQDEGKGEGAGKRKVCVADGCPNVGDRKGQLCVKHGGKSCSVDGCSTKSYARGLCKKHGTLSRIEAK